MIIESYSYSEVLSLQETLNRAREEHIHIGRYFHVRGIKSGELAARKIGKTYLIRWDLFLAWVLCEPSPETSRHF